MHGIKDYKGRSVLEEYFKQNGLISYGDVVTEKEFFIRFLFNDQEKRLKSIFIDIYRIPGELYDFGMQEVPLSTKEWCVYRIADFFRLIHFAYGIMNGCDDTNDIPGWNDQVWQFDFLLVQTLDEQSIIECLAQHPDFMTNFQSKYITNKILNCKLSEFSVHKYKNERGYDAHTMKDLFVKAEKYPVNEQMAKFWLTEIKGEYTKPAVQFFRNNYNGQADAVIETLRIKHINEEAEDINSCVSFF